MQDKQILQAIKDAYDEFFEWRDKQNALDKIEGREPIEPSFREFMLWLEEEKLSK
ncbi:MAG: hypothetical protein ABFQ62_03645 [Patescibacteria group bacterium]